MPDRDFIVAPSTPSVTVSIEPVYNALHSLLMLVKPHHAPGHAPEQSEWVARAASALTPDERHRNKLVMIGLHFATMPTQSWSSFPAYLDHLAASDPQALRDKMLDVYARIPLISDDRPGTWYDQAVPYDPEVLLEDIDSYMDFLRARFCTDSIDEELEAEAYRLALDPPAMRTAIVSHLREMWDTHLASEWARVEPGLRDAVRAFQQVDLSDKDKLQAARTITGQELKEEKWGRMFDQVDRVILVPSVHASDYLGKFCAGGKILWMTFRPRHPETAQASVPELNQAEVLVRLNALADNNRLRILKLVSERGEQCSQDIISALDLSQSTVSRHLKQLCTAGYLVERRSNGKCYSLSSGGVEESLQAISAYILND